MDEIKIIFPAVEDLLQLNNGCCCAIEIPEGYAHGPKLTIVIDPE